METVAGKRSFLTQRRKGAKKDKEKSELKRMHRRDAEVAEKRIYYLSGDGDK